MNLTFMKKIKAIQVLFFLGFISILSCRECADCSNPNVNNGDPETFCEEDLYQIEGTAGWQCEI